jgi:EAL and modified HD-GYP domain-containing signal transduction protein
VLPEPRDRRFLIRQPLLDAGYRVSGYALSLRDRVPVPVLPGAESFEQARDEYLIASVIDLEHQQVLGDRIVILDLWPATLTNPMLSGLPPGKVAAALPASLPDLAGHSKRLVEMGLLPLFEDDCEDPPATLPPGCYLVRLDSGRLDAMGLGNRAEHYRRLGAKRLIAGNVDSEEGFEVCRKLDFDLVQGGFLGQPRPGRSHTLDVDVVQVMELLNQTIEKAPFDQLEEGVKRNAALSYRLLRYINSPANGLDQPMASIGQALMWLGHEPLYRWLSLLLFSTGKPCGRDGALLRNALVRARFMENLGAGRLEPKLRGGLFIVGILSHLDALLDMPLASAIAGLKLPVPMLEALLESKGVYAAYLRLAVACERFDQTAVETEALSSVLTDEAVNLAHVNAMIWMETLER